MEKQADVGELTDRVDLSEGRGESDGWGGGCLGLRVEMANGGWCWVTGKSG